MSLPPMTPRETVAELDRYIVGQSDAKRAVAIALRNRWRRQQLPEDLQREVMPSNIILIGPTGVGKTEIARRVARLADAPFVKVEASKFTEVGYMGRDVDSIVRDLIEAAVAMVKAERAEKVQVVAQRAAEDRLVDLLLPPPPARSGRSPGGRSGACCARAPWRTARSRSTSPRPAAPPSTCSAGRAWRRWR